MIEFPKQGHGKHGVPQVFAKQLKADYARQIGVTSIEADRIIDCVGAVIHDRMLRGLPCGIPYVGVVYMRFRRHRRFHVSGVSGTKTNPVKKKEVVFPLHAAPRLWMSKRMYHFFRDHASFAGDLHDLFKKAALNEKEVMAWQKKQKEIQREKNGGKLKVGRKRGNPTWAKKKLFNQERKRMDDIRKKRRMIVEDGSAVEVDRNGRDEIIKTNDRKETVKTLKESKTGPKPIHD